jgi:hypothetical protein
VALGLRVTTIVIVPSAFSGQAGYGLSPLGAERMADGGRSADASPAGATIAEAVMLALGTLRAARGARHRGDLRRRVRGRNGRAFGDVVGNVAFFDRDVHHRRGLAGDASTP